MKQRVVRFEKILPSGEVVGLAHACTYELPDKFAKLALRCLERELPIPSPYPNKTIAFFTRYGVKNNKELIRLWLQASKHGTLVVRREWVEPLVVQYADKHQVLVTAKNVHRCPVIR